MEIYKRSKIIIFSLLFLLFFLAINFCCAANLQDAFKLDDKTPLKPAVDKAGFNTNADFNVILGLVITTALSVIGVVFLCLAIFGGYSWMVARGNEELVEKAKNTITNAIIGLVIVVAAYAITYFVLAKITIQTLK